MRDLLRFLFSRGAAIALMLVMAGTLALASLVPEPDLQPDRIETLRRARPVAAFVVERLRPAEVARSPIFVALAALVFVSTARSIAERMRTETARRRSRPGARLERFQARGVVQSAALPEEALAGARAELRRRRYRVEPAAEVAARRAGDAATTVTGTRGGLGFAGSIAFHVGILVVMAGIAASALTRVNGEVMLVEGFPVALGPETVARATRPAALHALEGTVVSIRDFTAEYDRGFHPVDFAALFETRERGRESRSQVARVNQGVMVQDFQFTLYRYGFAPEVLVTGNGGKPLAEGTAVLRVIPPGTEDGLTLADGSELQLSLYPDHAELGGRHATRSMLPVDPVLVVRHLDRGKELARGWVRRGAAAHVGTLRVTFPGLRYWADFQLGRDAGLWFIAAGSGLIALGLALRFLFDPQTLRFEALPAPGGSRLAFVMSARYFPALNEERARAIERSLSGRLGAGEKEAA